MAANELTHRRYRQQRAAILENASICGICNKATCPWCAGRKPHCGPGLRHVHHPHARIKGGPLMDGNMVPAHACCNLKLGEKDQAEITLTTSREW